MRRCESRKGPLPPILIATAFPQTPFQAPPSPLIEDRLELEALDVLDAEDADLALVAHHTATRAADHLDVPLGEERLDRASR